MQKGWPAVVLPSSGEAARYFGGSQAPPDNQVLPGCPSFPTGFPHSRMACSNSINIVRQPGPLTYVIVHAEGGHAG